MTASTDSDQSAGNPDLFANLPAMLRQRRRIIGVTTALGLVVSTAIAFALPNVYRSSALLIVQSSQLPSEVTGEGTGQGEIVDRRIARIRQQITSRPDLTALITKHGLYPDRRALQSMTKIIEDMRKAIVLEPTTAELPGNFENQRTVAVRLSFDYSNPGKAQAVTQELMQKLLDLDSSGNAQQASNTADFLNDQAKTLQAQISDVQGKINAITGANGRALAARGMTMVGGGGAYDMQIAQLERDNATLAAQKEAAKSADARDPAVVAAETRLAAARAMYSDNHPDVQLARQQLAQARQFARASASPVSSTLDSQISSNNQQIAALRAAKGAEQAQVSASISAQSRAPVVEQQIAQLQQQLTGLNQQYQSVSGRLLAAKAGVKAEDEQIAERLSVAEPPVSPDKPESPNRPLIILLGTVLGLALGLAFTFVVEMILKPVRSPKALAQLVGGIEPLGIVPVIGPAHAPVRRWSFSPAEFWVGLRADVQGILGRNAR